jgi:Tfp pilus assembly protein PilF
LHDAPGLAHAIEAAYRTLWDAWRERDIPHLHQLYAQNDLAGTKAIARHMLERDPADPEAHHVLGLLAYREKRLQDADSHLQAAISHTPEHAELHANHAAILRSLGRLAEAEAAARAALALEPQHTGAHNNLGNILRDSGRYGESVDCFRAAVAIAPDFTDAWINLAWTLALAGGAGRETGDRMRTRQRRSA